MRSARTAIFEVGPGRFRADLRVEFRRMFNAPRDEMTAIVVNAALVTGLWFLLPPAMKDWLFALTGPAAFAVVLETWMLADVPATNVVGNDVGTMVPALADPPRLQQLLRAKSVALALVVGIPCAVVSIVIGVVAGAWWRGVLLACVLVALPFGASSIAAWLGIIAPYRPLPLRWRWTPQAVAPDDSMDLAGDHPVPVRSSGVVRAACACDHRCAGDRRTPRRRPTPRKCGRDRDHRRVLAVVDRVRHRNPSVGIPCPQTACPDRVNAR